MAALAVSFGLGGTTVAGLRAGWYGGEAAVELIAVATMLLFVLVVWLQAAEWEDRNRIRERDAAALRDSEERLRAILDNANAPIYMKDLEGRLLFINRQCEQVFRVTREQVFGRRYDDFFPGEVAETLRAHDLQILATGQPLEFEELVQHDDGLHTYVSLKFPLVDSCGVTYGICGMSTDITARTRTETALQESEARLTLALGAARMGLWDLELATDRTHRTLMHDQIFGYAEAQTDWSYAKFFGHVLREDRQLVEAALQQAFVTGRFSFDCRIVRHGDRSVRWISLQGQAFRNEHGEPMRLMGLIADVTERKEAEALLRQRTLQLEAANEALGSFTYSVSHDLRTPLRGINGYARMLLEDHARDLAPEARRLLGVISDNANQMGRLIDDLLMFARLGRSEMDKTAVDLASVAHTVVDELRRLEPERAVTVTIGELGAVHADGSMLRQVLANLIGNAWKFTRGRGDAIIEVGCLRIARETVHYVRDNGAGFDMRYAGKLFGVFQRLHHPDEFEGTGVGLAIVQRIVQRHGGRVWAQSEVGCGATFSFTLGNDRVARGPRPPETADASLRLPG
jgi:PAS domain S-box-containing protein